MEDIAKVSIHILLIFHDYTIYSAFINYPLKCQDVYGKGEFT